MKKLFNRNHFFSIFRKRNKEYLIPKRRKHFVKNTSTHHLSNILTFLGKHFFFLIKLCTAMFSYIMEDTMIFTKHDLYYDIVIISRFPLFLDCFCLLEYQNSFGDISNIYRKLSYFKSIFF